MNFSRPRSVSSPSYRVDIVDETESPVPRQFFFAAYVGQSKCVALLQHLQSNSEHVHWVVDEGGFRLKHSILCTYRTHLQIIVCIYFYPASFRETYEWLKFPLNELRARSRVCPVVGLLTLASGSGLLDTWEWNGSTSGPTPWQIYDDNDLLLSRIWDKHVVMTADGFTYNLNLIYLKVVYSVYF